MFIIATRSNDPIHDTPPPFTPGGNFRDNFDRVLGIDEVHFWEGLINSLIVCVAITVSVVITSTLAGFAFAKLKFKGRNVLLLAMLATMMVPTQLGIIPLYGMMQDLDLFDSLLAGHPAVPDQRVRRVHDAPVRRVGGLRRADRGGPGRRLLDPAHLLERRAARAAPGGRRARSAHLHGELEQLPLAVRDPRRRTRPSRSRWLHVTQQFYTDYSMVFAATAVATVPLVLVFIVFGRQIIGGLMEGAVKA